MQVASGGHHATGVRQCETASYRDGSARVDTAGMSNAMLRRLGRRGAPLLSEVPEVSQPMPLHDSGETLASAPLQLQGVSVTEFSEMEARALCAREGLAVIWPRSQDRQRV